MSLIARSWLRKIFCKENLNVILTEKMLYIPMLFHQFKESKPCFQKKYYQVKKSLYKIKLLCKVTEFLIILYNQR